jgi:CheY-like chemotaxis protein
MALPRAEAQETPDEDAGELDRAAEAADFRVLVVDDNATNREVARALLGALGVMVTTADSGALAVEMLAVQRFDFVLMDIHMPGMSGIEALARIRAGPRGAIPVAACTADAMTGERERLLGLGFDSYLSKPIDPAALVALLDAA